MAVRRTWLVVLVCVAAGSLLFATSGCTSQVTAAQISSDPERYYGKVVSVEGMVSDGYSVAGYALYRLEDATGDIWVVSRSGGPGNGSAIRVKGRVNSPVDIGLFSIGTHVAEDVREPLE
ncbi:MAG: hypothetical protein Q8M66_03085 [Actinomycetota bacterium]|nr:hypothetical protein [Actinomycetota bacterium]MDZ4178112.1 hypothetical protein [Coriobacteriia bacterium]